MQILSSSHASHRLAHGASLTSYKAVVPTLVPQFERVRFCVQVLILLRTIHADQVLVNVMLYGEVVVPIVESCNDHVPHASGIWLMELLIVRLAKICENSLSDSVIAVGSYIASLVNQLRTHLVSRFPLRFWYWFDNDVAPAPRGLVAESTSHARWAG